VRNFVKKKKKKKKDWRNHFQNIYLIKDWYLKIYKELLKLNSKKKVLKWGEELGGCGGTHL
jgi:hypothetical protein